MNHDQTAELLALAAAFDRRTVGRADVIAWQDALADVPAADAMSAVKAHFRTSDNYLMPSAVRAAVAAMRTARLDATPIDRVALPADLDPDDVARYLTWRRATAAAIADGTYAAPPTPAVIRANPDVTGVLRSIPTETQRAAAERAQRETARVAGEAERARQLAALHQIGDAS